MLDRLLPWIGMFGLLCIWQASVIIFNLPHYILPPLDMIWHELVTNWSPLSRALMATLYEAGVGFALGALLGVGLAFIATISPVFERAIMPVIVAINSVPVVAYVPVALIALGPGPASKIAMVMIAVGFTVLLSAVQGLTSCDRNVENLLRSFGAGIIRITLVYRLPSALPFIMSALRVSVVRAMIIAIVAEMLGAYEGLGRVIYESTQQVDFLRTWAAIVIASAASVILYSLFAWADKKLVWWN